jgi:ABC-type multidrug transport system fused ATPase/permease subunit
MHRLQHTIVSRLVEYVAIVSAVANDVLVTALRSAAWFLVLALLRILFVSVSLYLLYALAQRASKIFSTPLSPGGLSELYLDVGLVLIALLASCLANYGSVRAALAVAVKIENLSIRRIFMLSAELPKARSLYANHVIATKSLLRGLASRDARSCGLAARLILTAGAEAVLALGAIGIMLYLDYGLTLILLGLIVGLAFLQYPAHRAAAHASRGLERTRPEFAKGIADAAEEMDSLDEAGHCRNDARGENPTIIPMEHSRNVYQRMLQTEYGRLIAESSSAIVLCTAISAMLYKAGAGAPAVPLLLLYIATARQALSHGTKLSRALSTVSRLFPQLARYWRFVWSATHRWNLLIPEIEVRRSSYKDWAGCGPQSGSEHAIRPGYTYLVYAKQGMCRSVVAGLIDGLGLDRESLAACETTFNFTPMLKLAQRHEQSSWHLWFADAADLGFPHSVGPAISTRILVTNVASNLTWAQGDFFVVLSATNRVVICTTDRSQAVSAVCSSEHASRLTTGIMEQELEDETL